MRRFLALVWLIAVAVALAALIHVTDAGIEGVGGLLSAKALPSLALLALLLTGLQAPSLIAFVRGGWKGLAVTVALTGVLIGLALAAAGVSTTSAERFSWSVLGGTAVAVAFLLVGVLPAAGVGWKRALRSTAS